ncbi:hypothetical protein EST38_g10206 [Candolleomyces aberdarensis]|uniref:Uncharacterized protein n=1 Tax=Candolleomyces aberdarensis TaxID=2316362 RepID=A0A4V1Q2M9_9AGAR|nr:hypothetical protein EST38_g10206 [Candolleomyces aberdarensis]
MAELADQRRVLSSDLVIQGYACHNIRNRHSINASQLSSDGRFVALGFKSGVVVVRDLALNGKRFILCNAGENIPIVCLLWHPSTDQRALFVASANGLINCISFYDDIDNPRPFATAVRVQGLVTCMAINKYATELAASHDTFTKVFKLPFKAGEPSGPEAGKIVPHVVHAGPNWQHIPVRNHPCPVGLRYAPDGSLYIAFFSRIVAYDTSKSINHKLWEISVPDETQIASFALSPSGRLIAATNLISGIEWFSAVTKTHLSTTKVEDDYMLRSFKLPIEFISDTTFVVGHNSGKVMYGSYGVDATDVLAVHEVNLPSQFLDRR